MTKRILLITLLQLAHGIAFSQEPDKVPEPVRIEKVEKRKLEIYDKVDEPAEFPGGPLRIGKIP